MSAPPSPGRNRIRSSTHDHVGGGALGASRLRVNDPWPLYGRDEHLAAMRALLGGQPAKRALAISGRAGVGKTRLATEFVNLLESKGDCSVVRVAATRAAALIPLGAFASVLPAMPRPTEARRRGSDILRLATDHLRASAGARPLVLHVEDAHLLDEVSALVVQHLFTARSAFVVLTLRSGEPTPGPILSIGKDDTTERWELGPLSIDALRAILDDVLDGQVDRAVAVHLRAETGGNVQLFHELVLGALDAEVLRVQRGVWRLTGETVATPRLTELVEARLRSHDEDDRLIVDVLAMGEPLGLHEVSSLAGTATIESLERRGVIAVSSDIRRRLVRTISPVYSTVLQARMTIGRRIEVAGTLVELFEKCGTRRKDDAIRLAGLRLHAGGGDPDEFFDAAKAARARNDLVAAERLARAAFAIGGAVEAGLLAAQVAGLQGRYAEMLRDLDSLRRTVVDDEARTAVAAARFESLVLHRGHVDEGLAILDEVAPQLTDDACREDVAAMRAVARSALLGPTAGIEVGLPLLGLGTARGNALTAVHTSYALARAGRTGEALVAANRGHEAQIASANWNPSVHLFSRTNALEYEGRFEYARMLALEQYERALEDGSGEAQALFAWQMCRDVADRGNAGTAASFAREAIAIFDHLGRRLQQSFALAALATALAVGGDGIGAVKALADRDDLAVPPTTLWAVDGVIARAWAQIASGDIVASVASLSEAGEMAMAIGDLVGRSVALHTLARVGRAAEVTELLMDLAHRLDGALGLARAEHAAALAADDATKLDQVSVDFESMSATLLSAEASADAAVAWLRRGDPRRAAASQRRGVVLADRCGRPFTPSLRAVSSRSQLTKAERNIALLAASGFQNKEIARRLGVSVRTVENHLQHVYSKLVISSRSELAERLASMS